MLHQQKIGKILVRLTLLLLLIQFVSPAFAYGGAIANTIHEKKSYDTPNDSGIAVSIFLKENAGEKSELTEKSQLSAPLIDFSFHTIALTQSHTNFYSHLCSQRLIAKPLFKLLCVFLI